MDGIVLAAEIRKLPGAAMLPLVLLMPLGIRADAPNAAHIAFANCISQTDQARAITGRAGMRVVQP